MFLKPTDLTGTPQELVFMPIMILLCTGICLWGPGHLTWGTRLKLPAVDPLHFSLESDNRCYMSEKSLQLCIIYMQSYGLMCILWQFGDAIPIA